MSDYTPILKENYSEDQLIHHYADGGEVQHYADGSPDGVQSSPFPAEAQSFLNNSTQSPEVGADSNITQPSPFPQEAQDFIAPEMQQQKYGGLGQQAITGLEGAARGVAGPLAPLAERAAGVPSEDILGRQEANPWASGLGEAAGFAGSMMTGVGEGRLVAGAGEALAKKIAEKTGESLASKIGSQAAKGAIENMMLSGSDQVSRMILQDPKTSAETALQTIGLNALLGGAVGGALGAVSPLWKAAAGNKVGQMLTDFKDRVDWHQNNPEPVQAMTDELNGYMKELGKVGSETYGTTGIKSEAIQKLVPELHEGMTGQVGDISSKLDDSLQKLGNDPHAGLLQDKINQFKQNVNTQEPAKMFDAIQTLKQQLQEDSRYTEGVSPLSERPYRNTVKSLAHDLRESLEDRDVWGKASDVQASINSAFSDYLKATKDFRGLMTTKVMGEPTIDPGKVNTYLNQLGKASAEIKSTKLRNYLDAGDQFKAAVNKAYDKIGVESPIQPTPLNVSLSTLDKMTPGAKLADLFVKKGMAQAGGKAAGAAIGGTLGHVVGAGGVGTYVGALIGEKALGPFFESALPALAKTFTSKEASAEGAKAATDYAMNVINGETKLNQVTKSLLSDKDSKVSLPTEKDRSKLDKALKILKSNPSALLSASQSVGYYLPDHNAHLNEVATQGAQYLNSLRPDQDPKAPLDPKLPPNPMQQAQYNRALDIAQEPLLVIDAIKKGTITPADLLTLKTIYPNLYAHMGQKLTELTIDQTSKGKTIPYKTRIGLSMFTGTPLDSTMTPASVMASQMVYMGKNQQAQQNPQAMGGKPKRGTGNLSKVSQQYKTPGQAAEEDHVKR